MDVHAPSSFFVWDTTDGKVAVEPAKPAGGDRAWPLQTLQATGPSLLVAPKSPMSAEEFAAWRENLTRSGWTVEIRFVPSHP